MAVRLSEKDFARLNLGVAAKGLQQNEAKGANNTNTKVLPFSKDKSRRKKIKKAAIPIVPETDIQKTILDYLERKKIYHKRMNTGAFVSGGDKDADGFEESNKKRRFIRFGFPGCPDIMLLGKPFSCGCGFIEVKRADGKLSEDQKDFKAFCLAENIPYLVARSLDEVIAWIALYDKNKG